MPTKKHHSERELIDTGRDKRYVRRDDQGRFKESDDVGRSLAADRRQHAKTKAKKGQGDRGDH
jgi:hypothetical protein